jgi:Tfp pilus assembly protein PilW
MRSARFIRTCNSNLTNRGFTLAETLTAAFMASIILGASMNLMVGFRQGFLKDQTKASFNQDLRTALDLTGADVKRMGGYSSNLPTSLSAVEVINGSSGQPDTLVLRRSQSTASSMMVCRQVNTGALASVPLTLTQPEYNTAVTASTPPLTGPVPAAGCNPVNNFTNTVVASTSSGFPKDLDDWRTFRCSQDSQVAGCQGNSGEVAQAYIYGPSPTVPGLSNYRGEFFTYSTESNTPRSIQASSGTTLQNQYAAYTTTVYQGIEERRYTLVNNPKLSGDKILQLTVNGGTPQNLASGLADFQVQIRTQDPSSGTTTDYTAFPPAVTSTNNATWKQIQYVQVAMTAKSPPQNILTQLYGSDASDPTKVKNNLTMTAQFFPRNILSIQ